MKSFHLHWAYFGVERFQEQAKEAIDFFLSQRK